MRMEHLEKPLMGPLCYTGLKQCIEKLEIKINSARIMQYAQNDWLQQLCEAKLKT